MALHPFSSGEADQSDSRYSQRRLGWILSGGGDRISHGVGGVAGKLKPLGDAFMKAARFIAVGCGGPLCWFFWLLLREERELRLPRKCGGKPNFADALDDFREVVGEELQRGLSRVVSKFEKQGEELMENSNLPIYFCTVCKQRVKPEDVDTSREHLTGLAHFRQEDGRRVECGAACVMVRTKDPMKQLAVFVRREIQAFDARMAAELKWLRDCVQTAIEFHGTLVSLPSEKEDLKPLLKEACVLIADLFDRVLMLDGNTGIDNEEILTKGELFLDETARIHPWAVERGSVISRPEAMK